jgi:DNA repair protein RecO (recombination protein O)
MLQNTRAIILRTVPFGETSLVVTAFTRVYGLQSYMVKGARSTGKKGQSLRPYLQPGALLDLVVYHHPTEHLQYIREMRWAKVYDKVLSSVVHHSIADFMLELLIKCIRQSEPNPVLFDAVENYFLLLDVAEPGVMANLPLHFALFLAGEMGFRPENNYSEGRNVFHLPGGSFIPESGHPTQSLGVESSRLLHQLLEVEHPVTLYRVKTLGTQRRALLKAMEAYFSIHIEGFGHIKSLPVLESLF